MADKNVLKQASHVLQENWQQLSKKDIAKSKGNVEELVKTIVDKTGDAADSVSERVNGIIDDVKGRRKKKTFLGRVRGFAVGVLKFAVAAGAIAAAAAVGLMFWRKRMEQTSDTGYSAAPVEPMTMDQSAVLHAPETVSTPPTGAKDDSAGVP